MKKIGFTIGKFAPLHKGHQYLIETALKELDEFYVIVYDTDLINVPIEQRGKWIENLYPEVHVLYAYNPPKQYGMDKKSIDIQMEYLKSIIKERKFTHFYSSEPYGEAVAKELNIIDRRVDNKREKYPISATEIRKNIEKNKNNLESTVFYDYKKYL